MGQKSVFTEYSTTIHLWNKQICVKFVTTAKKLGELAMEEIMLNKKKKNQFFLHSKPIIFIFGHNYSLYV